MDIVLISPGSTEYDAQGRVQGSLEIRLSDQGRAEVAEMAQSLKGQKFELLYAPQTHPAWETGELLAKALDLRLKKLEAFRNVDHGLWQGMRVDEIRQKHPRVFRQWQEAPETIFPPEGESLAEVNQRVQLALDKLLKRHKTGPIGLIAPMPVSRFVRDYLKNVCLGSLSKPGNMNGRVQLIQVGQPRAAAARDG